MLYLTKIHSYENKCRDKEFHVKLSTSVLVTSKMSKTTFDSVKKVWSNSANPDEDRVPLGTFLGPAILKKLRESNADRIAEYNHDAGDLITIKQLYEGTITAAKNMQNLEIGKDDIIAIYARHNSYITKIAFACYILGVPWCPLDYVQGTFSRFFL